MASQALEDVSVILEEEGLEAWTRLVMEGCNGTLQGTVPCTSSTVWVKHPGRFVGSVFACSTFFP